MNSLGKLAELKACDYLREKHYKLLDVNYSSRYGEIDLIMKKGRFICFIEVKMRNSASIATPAEFVDAFKQEKIAKTATLYLQKYPTKLQPRFDVVEVIAENSEIKSIKHLENAFELY